MPSIPAEIYSLIAERDPIVALRLRSVNRHNKTEITRRLGEWLLTRYLPTLVVPTWYAPYELHPKYYQLLVNKFFTPGVSQEMVVEKPHLLGALLGDLLRQMGTRNFDKDIKQYTRTVLLLMGGAPHLHNSLRQRTRSRDHWGVESLHRVADRTVLSEHSRLHHGAHRGALQAPASAAARADPHYGVRRRGWGYHWHFRRL